MNRIRLLPVLVFGLVSLLTIKLLSLAVDTPRMARQMQGDTTPGERIARAVEKAREGSQEDQIVTGSVGGDKDKDKAAKDQKKPAVDVVPEGGKPKLKSEPEGVRLPAPPNAQPDRGVAASPTERELLEKLKDRREALAARDREMEMRDSLLRATERKIDEKIGQLRTLEGQAEGGAAGKNDPKSRYRPLVVMYESMKPKEAARVFDRLDIKVLIDLVGHMNPRKVSDIMAVMEPAAAEKLTVALARQASMGAIPDATPAMAQDTELPRLPPQNPVQPRR